MMEVGREWAMFKTKGWPANGHGKGMDAFETTITKMPNAINNFLC